MLQKLSLSISNTENKALLCKTSYVDILHFFLNISMFKDSILFVIMNSVVQVQLKLKVQVHMALNVLNSMHKKYKSIGPQQTVKLP